MFSKLSSLCGVKGASLVAQIVKNLQYRRPRFLPRVGKIPWRRENGHPLQYSCLQNFMDRGDWWAIVHRVAELDMTE